MKMNYPDPYWPARRKHMGSLELVTDYWFDVDKDGRRGEAEDNDQLKDMNFPGINITAADETEVLAFFTVPAEHQVLVVDFTAINPAIYALDDTTRSNPLNKAMVRPAKLYAELNIDTVGEIEELVVDGKERVIYLTDTYRGLVMVDGNFYRSWNAAVNEAMNAGMVDANVDRVLGVIPTSGQSQFGLTVDTQLNTAYVGQMGKGVDAVKLKSPELRLVYLDESGMMQEAQRICPEGIKAGDNPGNYPAEIYVMAKVPGGAGPVLYADVLSLNAEGEVLVSWADGSSLFNTPETMLKEVPLYRQSDDQGNPGYNIYMSKLIKVTVKPFENIPGEELALLGGDWVMARLSPKCSSVFAYLSGEDCEQAMGWTRGGILL